MERIGLFDGLNPEERSVAKAALKPYVIGAGEELLREGEADRSLLVVVDGGLRISLGDVDLADVGPGDIVGEMALFGTFDRRSATVTSTVGPTKLLILDEEALKFLRIQGSPMVRNIEAFAMRGLYRRIQEMELRIAELTEPEAVPSPSLLGRIASVFGFSSGPTAFEVLSIVPGFASREPQTLKAIASRLSVEGASKGKAIIRRGEGMTGAWMVANGSVGVFPPAGDGVTARAAVLGPGHLFGRVGSTLEPVSETTVSALEPSWLLYLPHDVASDWEQGNGNEPAAFRRGMIDALATQLRLMNEFYLATVLRAGG